LAARPRGHKQREQATFDILKFSLATRPGGHKQREKTRGEGGGCHPPVRFFQGFEKTIYSKGLKLSVAVPLFSVEISIYQLCVYHF